MHQRIEKVRKRIQELNLDAFLTTSLVNIRYLFGFTGSNAIALITPVHTYFVTDRRYTNQANLQVKNSEILIAVQDLFAPLKSKNILLPGNRVGFEAEYLTVKQFIYLRKHFPEIKWIGSEKIIELIASVKDTPEIELIQQAGKICGKVYEELLTLIKPGVSELDISAEISYRCKKLGSEKDPFEPIVASGWRSALPHGISTQKQIEPGELIILDFGATIQGYTADFTRTVVVGKPNSKQKKLAQIVREALQLAEHSTKPGLTGQTLDKIVRDFIGKHGYGPYFQHSLGHGLGLDVHSLPRIGMRSRDKIEERQVVALEPGIYLPDLGGVRIEDDFVVTKSGVENLTPFPRELVSV